MARWLLRSVPLPEPDWGQAFHPVTRTLLARQGVFDDGAAETFFHPDYDRDLHDPFLFRAMARIVERVRLAREAGEPVGVFGDYDVDGVTSASIMRTVLEALGLNVSVYIPDKITEGHGLHVNALDAFEKQGIKLYFTVDCGMTNHVQIAEGNRRGMEAIVVDHHHVPEVLPEAYAIVNPRLKDETYPFKELCGAGCSFKVATALYRALMPEQEKQLKWLLDLAATGTVADCMPLVGENRTLVHYGLIVLAKTQRVGLQELFAIGKIQKDLEPLTAWTISFQIAPRLNAAGRMAHAQAAHELIMETDRVKARVLALEIEQQNIDRKKLSDMVVREVRRIADERFRNRKFILAVGPEFAFGVAGLVAGKIARECNKPTIVLHQGETESQGSLRSITGLNIIETLTRCGDLLEKFGGHAMAAGLTIRNENLAAFEERLGGLIEEQLQDVVTEPETWYDAKIELGQVTPELVNELKRFAPFGEGNPEPLFLIENAVIGAARLVGNGSKHWKLLLQAGETGYKEVDAIAFGLGERFPELMPGTRVDILAQPDENRWNGHTSIQLKVMDLRLAAGQ